MKTLVLQIDDLIFEDVVTFLQTFPTNRLKMLTKEADSPFVSAAEQDDIEDLLHDPDCFVIAHRTTVTI